MTGSHWQPARIRQDLLTNKGAGVPVSDSSPMHMKPVRFGVCAPPDTWRWEVTVVPNLLDESKANPTHATDRRSDFFRHNQKESDALWSRSNCFRGEGHDSASL